MAYIQNTIDYSGPGIYMLREINNGYVYVGKAKNVNQRIKEHNRQLAKNNGQSKFIQRKLSGDEVFEAVLLEKISPERTLYYLNNREYYYIKKYDAYGESGLNSATVKSMLRADIEYLCRVLKEFEERESANSEKGTRYTEFLMGATERSILERLKYMEKYLQCIVG